MRLISDLGSILVQDEITTNDLGYYTLATNLNTMTLKKFNSEDGVKIIMFGDCHFAIDAIKALDRNPDLSQIMAETGLVIGSYDFSAINSLKKDFPNFVIHPIYKEGAWFQ